MATVENFVVKVATQGVEQLNRLGSVADSVNGKLNALSGALLGVGFGAFIAGALRSADAMVDLSDATGLSVASIKAFGESMRLAGGNSKGAERAIMTLFGSIEAAAAGGLKQQEAFDKVGVSLKDLENLSEADILQKTIEGLAKIPAGSERAAAATALLGRSFRSVEAQKFLETLDPQQYAVFEANAKKAADTMERFENIFATLQQGALQALDPLLGYLEKIKFSADDAATGFKVVGTVLALVFGARMVAQIVAFNKALGITAGIANLIGKSPVGLFAKLIAAGATTAAGAAAVLALEELMSANEGVQATAEAAAKAQGKLQQTNPSTGPANRKITPAQNPEEQARLDSERRILQAQSDIRRLGESKIYDEIANIRARSTADITKMEAEVNAQRLLTRTQKEREIAERRIAIEKAAEFEIEKFRTEQQKKLADQLANIALSTQERQAAFDLEKKILTVNSQQADKLRALAEIDRERRRTISELGRDPTLSPEVREAQVRAIEEQYKAQEILAEQQIEFQRSFETGWTRAFQSYMDSATNAARQAEAIFSAMTNNMNRALDNFVDTGKFSFSDLANSIIKDIIKIQLRAAAANLFSAGANFLGFKLPGRAAGGPVSAGNPYIVGEQGPEVFIPAAAGNIIPNSRLGSATGTPAGQTVVNYNIQAVDALSFKQLVAKDPSFLYAVTEQGRKSIPTTRR